MSIGFGMIQECEQGIKINTSKEDCAKEIKRDKTSLNIELS